MSPLLSSWIRSKSQISSALKGRGSHKCVDFWEPPWDISATLGNKIKMHNATRIPCRSKEAPLREAHNFQRLKFITYQRAYRWKINLRNIPAEGVVFS